MASSALLPSGVWLALEQTAAAQVVPAVLAQTGVTKTLIGWGIVLLCIGLGLLVVCRPAARAPKIGRSK